jgi:hypothetical protein
MKALKISALAALLLGLPTAVQAGGGKPGMGMNHGGPVMGGYHGGRPMMGNARNWGGRQNGRWIGGHRAPGGWNSYRRPYVGYVLPRYWVNPNFYLGNYWAYGFAQPSQGYGWSRYYDDAVMTDQYGRVQDYVPGVNWDQYDRYDDGDSGYGEDYSDSYGYANPGAGYGQPRYEDRGYRGKDRDGGLGGGLIGGAMGAIAGTAIAHRGAKTEGALIGGVVGAVAGAAIDAGDNAGRGPKRKRYSNRDMDYGRGGSYGQGGMDYDYGYGGMGDGVTTDGHWAGTWRGSFDGGPTRTWTGTFDGQYRGSAPVGGAVAGAPHWSQGGFGQGPVMMHQGQGWGYGQGWGGGEVTTVTVQSQPVVTTTTEVIEEVSYVSQPVRKRYAAKKVWKPRPKARPRCVCKVVYR